MITQPEIRTLNYYEELDVLFNYIDYQIRKQRFGQAGQAIIEFYDILSCKSYLESKSSAYFKDYIQITKNVNIEPTNPYELICLLYMYSKRNSYLDIDVWDKYSKQINDFNKDFDTFHILGDEYYWDIKTAYEINPSAKNLYLLACKGKDTFNEIRNLQWSKQRIEKKITLDNHSNNSLTEELSYELQEIEDEIRFYEKEVTKSIEILKEAIKQDSNHFFSHNLLGELHVLKGENQLAKDCFFACLQIFPNYYRAILNLLNLYSNSRDFHSIITEYNNIHSFQIYVDEHYKQIGQIAALVMAVYWKLNLFEKADNIFKVVDGVLSGYAKKRNEQRKFGKLEYHKIMEKAEIRYLNLVEDSTPSDILNLLKVILDKYGDHTWSQRIIRSYLNAFLLENAEIDFKRMAIEGIEDYCSKEVKLLSSDEFDEYQEDDELNFGKYKGKTIKYIVENDFQYLTWCVNSMAGFFLSPEVLYLVIKKSGVKHLKFIMTNMSKDFISECYEQREYELEAEMERASENFKSENWEEYARREYRDFGGIE